MFQIIHREMPSPWTAEPGFYSEGMFKASSMVTGSKEACLTDFFATSFGAPWCEKRTECGYYFRATHRREIATISQSWFPLAYFLPWSITSVVVETVISSCPVRVRGMGNEPGRATGSLTSARTKPRRGKIIASEEPGGSPAVSL